MFSTCVVMNISKQGLVAPFQCYVTSNMIQEICGNNFVSMGVA